MTPQRFVNSGLHRMTMYRHDCYPTRGCQPSLVSTQRRRGETAQGTVSGSGPQTFRTPDPRVGPLRSGPLYPEPVPLIGYDLTYVSDAQGHRRPDV